MQNMNVRICKNTYSDIIANVLYILIENFKSILNKLNMQYDLAYIKVNFPCIIESIKMLKKNLICNL